MAKNKLPTSMPSNPVAVQSRMAYEDRKYKAEDALRTIERAEAHKADKGLMKDVKAMAKDKMKCLSKIK